MFIAFVVAFFAVFWGAIIGFVTFVRSYQTHDFFEAKTFQELEEEQRAYRRMWRWGALGGAFFGMFVASELEANSREIARLYEIWKALGFA